jgi:hypothetical protein
MARVESDSLFSVLPVSSQGEPLHKTAGLAPAGYGLAPTGEPIQPFVLAAKAPRPKAQKRGASPPLQRPETRAALRSHWRTAQASAEAMLAAAQKQDGEALLIAADNLELVLGKLWELRDVRDINWRSILNHAQGMLRQLFAAKVVEQLTPEQCRCVIEIMARHLGPATKSVEDLNEVLRLIEDAGADPFGAISGGPSEDCEEESSPGSH